MDHVLRLGHEGLQILQSVCEVVLLALGGCIYGVQDAADARRGCDCRRSQPCLGMERAFESSIKGFVAAVSEAELKDEDVCEGRCANLAGGA